MDVAEDRGFCSKIANVCRVHVLLALGLISSACAALPVPERVLIGGADDWTPPAPCAALAARAGEHGWPLETTVYPGAHHGFDAPSGRVRLRVDVPNGVAPGKGVHVGPDPAARADANRRVDAFLREQLWR